VPPELLPPELLLELPVLEPPPELLLEPPLLELPPELLLEPPLELLLEPGFDSNCMPRNIRCRSGAGSSPPFA
jgi:hypothetical protein